jgi:anti-anti-sigma factor
MEFNITTSRPHGDASVIAITGEFDLASVMRVEADADEVIAEKRPLLLDLSQCTFIDSSALRLVLRIRRNFESADLGTTPMVVVAGDSPVRKMFSVTAIDQSVPVVPTLEEAEESIRTG